MILKVRVNDIKNVPQYGERFIVTGLTREGNEYVIELKGPVIIPGK